MGQLRVVQEAEPLDRRDDERPVVGEPQLEALPVYPDVVLAAEQDELNEVGGPTV